MKKILALILSITLCVGYTSTAFAVEATKDTIQNVETEAKENSIMPRAISGYGQALGLENTSGSFKVPVTVTSGNGYGLTLKTKGSGTAIISVYDPNGKALTLSGGGTYVTMNNTDEKAWNFKGIKAGDYTVSYMVMDGPIDVICHIYG